MNPLYSKYTTKYESIPFSKIKNEHFLPAFIEGIKLAEKDIAEIVSNTENPSFKNTLEALENSGEMLSRTAKVFYNLTGAHTSEEIQKIAQQVSPMLSKLSNDKVLNQALFLRIKAVFENQDKETLTTEQEMLLKENYNYFVRNGANLEDTDKETLRGIDTKLSKLSLTFGENILKEMNTFEMHISDQNDLAGLPTGVKEAAAIAAKQKGKDGWVFTLDGPSLIPFMTYAENRALRQKMHKASTTKAGKGDEFDNQDIIKEIVSLRFNRANLLGYKSHADFVLEETMATSPAKVFDFLNDLLVKAKPFAIEDYKELSEFSVKNGGPIDVMPYDVSFYVEKLKKEKFDIDVEALKPYFKLENVINGAFIVAEKLYGLQFEEIFDIDTYHKDVKTYKVTDEKGALVSLFYADFFPRESKQNGAWMNSLKPQFIKDGINHRPHIVNVCNFTKPTETKPSLLTFNEVVTLFHEFGHGLHGMLANTQYKDLSGTSVYRDFVELPSQVLENWCFEKEALSLFAFHYETGEVIPDELIKKIKESSNFREATQMLRQISFATIDMGYHTVNPETITDIKAFEKEQTNRSSVSPTVDYACFSTGFAHIFAGGYSAGYYSYKWAEVLDADAFEYFKEQGIFNREIGERFKETILSKGGTKHPMELYKDFRGAEPDNTALLKRAGLLELA
ncbi:MAG: Zn-dependent oligopeptidase [Planctomycetota bacterium]|jgi:Zn-dependent oligopeptidase